MAVAYSMDLRERVIKDADAGLSTNELAARYHVRVPWVNALKQRRRETGSIAPRPRTKFRHRVLEGQEDRLRGLVNAQPDATLAELRDAVGTTAALATIWRELNQLDLTVKKTVHVDEQRRPDVAAQRRQWRHWLPLHDATQYVFLDECGVTTDLL